MGLRNVSLLLLLLGCAPSAAKAPEVAEGPVRIFIQGLLTLAEPERSPARADMTFEELSASVADESYVSTPHVLADDGKAASLDLSDPTPVADSAQGVTHLVRFEATPHLEDSSGRIRVDLLLDYRAGPTPTAHTARTTLILTPGQLATVPLTPPDLVFFLQAEVVRSQADLLRIFERKVRARQSSTRRPQDAE